MRQRKMKQQKMKQRKSKQSKSLAKILTLGIAAATVVSSMSVPGGLLAPEKMCIRDSQGTEPWLAYGSQEYAGEKQDQPVVQKRSQGRKYH